MTNHLDEMKIFLEVVHAYSRNMLNETFNPIVEEKPLETIEEDIQHELFEDLQNLKETWLEITADGDEEFSRGYEAGLYKAVEMLENLLQSKYSRRL